MVARCCGPGAPRQRAKVRKPAESQIHLQRSAFDSIAPDRGEKLRVKLFFLQQAEKRHNRIEVRYHHRGGDLLAALQHHSASPAAAHEDPLDRGAGPDSRAFAARRIRHGARDGAHAAADESPQPSLAAYAAHAVMQQDIGGAGRARAAVGADHPIGRQGHFHFRRFEPLIQKVCRALGEYFNQPDHFLAAQLRHSSGDLQILQEISRRSRREIRGSGEQHGLDKHREPLQMIFVRGINFGVPA